MKNRSSGKFRPRRFVVVATLLAAALPLIAMHTPVFASDVKVTLTPSPTITSADGRFQTRVVGFAQADFSVHDDDVIDHPNGSTIRRARLGVVGRIDHVWGYKLLHDFGNNGNPALQDMFISYTAESGERWVVGQFKEPVGLEWQSPAKYWTFMELPLTTALTPRRAVGIARFQASDRWSVRAGVFGENASQTRSDEEASSLDLHAAYRFVLQDNQYLHLGGSLSYRLPDSETDSISVRAKQETSTIQAQTINTGAIGGVDGSLLAGIEALWIAGSLSLQAEYVTLSINRENSLDSLRFDAYYLQGAYLITGESRQFSFAKHGFRAVKPNQPLSPQGGEGAWELALRYDVLNADDDGLNAGVLGRTTLGVNWYLNNHIRLTADVAMSDSNEDAALANDNTNTLSFRAQVAF